MADANERETRQSARTGRAAAAASGRAWAAACATTRRRMVRLVVAEDEVAFDLAGGALRPRRASPRPARRASRRRRAGSRGRSSGDRQAGRRPSSAAGSSRRATAGWRGSSWRPAGPARSPSAPTPRSEALDAGAPLAVVAVDAGSIAQTVEVAAAPSPRGARWRGGRRASSGRLLGGSERSPSARSATPASPRELKVSRAAADAARG